MSTLNLPLLATLGNGDRVRITRVDASDIVFDRLGAAPAEGQPEDVVAPACGVAGGDFSGLAAVIAKIENPPAPLLDNAQSEALLDAILDGWAKERGYASAARCITYVGDPEPIFAGEALAMRASRSALWVAVRTAAATPGAPTGHTEAEVRAFAEPFRPVWPS